MDYYRAGDKVYIFGFSRGAYTARALAGMIQKVGLLPPGNHNQIKLFVCLLRYPASRSAEIIVRTLIKQCIRGVHHTSYRQDARQDGHEYAGRPGGHVSPDLWDLPGGPDRISGCMGELIPNIHVLYRLKLTCAGHCLQSR